VLCTYWELPKKWDTAKWVQGYADAGLPRPHLLIDSGVYTARQAGVAINAEEYSRWLARVEWRGMLAGAIDVDWPPIASEVRKHTALVRRAVGAEHTLPVLHPYLGPKDVEEYCEQHTWCSVGSYGTGNISSGASEFVHNADARRNRMRWFEYCHGVAARYGTKLHALGVGCTHSVLEGFDWASADSSVLGICQKYGGTYLWSRTRLRHLRPGTKGIVQAAVEHGLSPKRLAHDQYYRYGATLLNIAAMERHYQRRNTNGFRFFVADYHLPKLVKATKVAIGLAIRRTTA
jgi:hypothetical protein